MIDRVTRVISKKAAKMAVDSVQQIGERALRRLPMTSEKTAPAIAGFVAGTRVATPQGWRPVDALGRGDKVLTFDHGLQPVLHVGRTVMSTTSQQKADLLIAPAYALDNMSPFRFLPGAVIMIESDLAEKRHGDPFALVPGAVLDGVRGVERAGVEDEIEITTFSFAQDEVVIVNGSALQFCPALKEVQHLSITDAAFPEGMTQYQAFDAGEAAELVQYMPPIKKSSRRA